MQDLFDLTDKVAIVTGGNGGIGRAIALALAQHGADIVVAARNEQKTATVVAEVEALGRRGIGVRCDVLRHDDISATVDTAVRELGSVNILVNNAGVGHGGQPTQSVALDTWQRVIDINLTSVFVFCQAVYPALVKAGGGKIINVGSGFSLLAGAGNAPYSASKAGVWNLTRTMALDWGSRQHPGEPDCPRVDPHRDDRGRPGGQGAGGAHRRSDTGRSFRGAGGSGWHRCLPRFRGVGFHHWYLHPSLRWPGGRHHGVASAERRHHRVADRGGGAKPPSPAA